MFEHSHVNDARRPPSFWLKIIGAVVFVLIVINVFRVNTPRESAKTPALPVEDTKGIVVQETLTVEAGSFVPYRVSFPYRSTLKGTFRSRERSIRLVTLILDEPNYANFRVGLEFTSINSTGRVPSGKVTRVLEAGTYYLIFDNRSGADLAIVEADFVVE